MIDPTLLEGSFSAKTANGLCQQLGPLAGYMLNDQAFAAAGYEPIRPGLSASVGACRPLIGVRAPAWRQFLLPAFFLPLQWHAGEPDDRRLPPDLLASAQRVRDCLFGQQGQRFGIGFQDRHQQWPDLQRLDAGRLDAASSFPALASGLYSAITGFAADAAVWASSVWNDRFDPVDLLAEKLETAQRWGADKFFVAPSQDVSALPPSATAILQRLERPTTAGPEPALAPLFAASILEPHAGDAAACFHYHRAVRELDRDKAVDFYQRVLIHHILERCRKTLRSSPSLAGIPEGGAMITIATPQPQPVPLLVGSLSTKRLLVLYTKNSNSDSGKDDMSKKAAQIEADCRRMFPEVQVDRRAFGYDPNSADFPADFLSDLQSSVNEFIAGLPAQEVVFDIDRGLTLHKIALLQHVIQPNHFLATLTHEFEGPGKIRHGSEQILLWRAGDDWTTPFAAVNDRPELNQNTMQHVTL